MEHNFFNYDSISWSSNTIDSERDTVEDFTITVTNLLTETCSVSAPNRTLYVPGASWLSACKVTLIDSKESGEKFSSSVSFVCTLKKFDESYRIRDTDGNVFSDVEEIVKFKSFDLPGWREISSSPRLISIGMVLLYQLLDYFQTIQ